LFYTAVIVVAVAVVVVDVKVTSMFIVRDHMISLLHLLKKKSHFKKIFIKLLLLLGSANYVFLSTKSNHQKWYIQVSAQL
jgi:hypothetical protein